MGYFSCFSRSPVRHDAPFTTPAQVEPVERVESHRALAASAVDEQPVDTPGLDIRPIGSARPNGAAVRSIPLARQPRTDLLEFDRALSAWQNDGPLGQRDHRSRAARQLRTARRLRESTVRFDHLEVDSLPACIDAMDCLRELHFRHCRIDRLPALPPNLEHLHAVGVGLTALPPLPCSLQELNVMHNLLETLPELPDDLIFHVTYLGGDMPVFQINFSRPAGQIVAQYYNFVRLGRKGYRAVQDSCYATSQFLAAEIVKLGPFELLCDGNPLTGIPTVAWRIIEGEDPGYTLYDVADRLRVKGWQVPAYPLTGAVADISIQRILVRQGVSRDLAFLLLSDMKEAIAHFDKHPVSVAMTPGESGGFSHL